MTHLLDIKTWEVGLEGMQTEWSKKHSDMTDTDIETKLESHHGRCKATLRSYYRSKGKLPPLHYTSLDEAIANAGIGEVP